MEALIAISASTSAVLVALINGFFSRRQRKKDDVVGRLSTIETNVKSTNDKVNLVGKGSMATLKIQLQNSHTDQQLRVRSKTLDWSQDSDQVFREAYNIYKELDGNGVVDRLKQDMDIWRDKYADESYVSHSKQ